MKPLALLLAVLGAIPQAAPAMRLFIDSPEKVLRPGQRMPIRLTIENAGSAEAKFDEPENYLEGLEILDPEGKVVKAVG